MYLINVSPKKEDKIKEIIKNIFGNDVEVYIPKVVEEDKGKIKERKVSPGNIFINTSLPLDEGEYFYKLKNIKGIYRITKLHQRDTEQFSNFKMNMEKRKEDNISEFKIGDTVEVVFGPFLGYKGKIVSVNKNTLKVSMNVFGRDTDVELSKEYVSII